MSRPEVQIQLEKQLEQNHESWLWLCLPLFSMSCVVCVIGRPRESVGEERIYGQQEATDHWTPVQAGTRPWQTGAVGLYLDRQRGRR